MTAPYEFTPGIDVHVELFGNHRRRPARLVGELGERHLVIGDVPGRDHSELTELDPGVGETLIVRFLERGVVRGFRSPVMRVLTDPEPFLVIGRPQRVDQVPVRRHPRLSCHIPARLEIDDGEPMRALVVDISRAGYSVALAAREVTPETTVTVRFRIPDSDDFLTLNGQVRRIQHAENRSLLGVSSGDIEVWFDTLAEYLALDGTLS